MSWLRWRQCHYRRLIDCSGIEAIAAVGYGDGGAWPVADNEDNDIARDAFQIRHQQRTRPGLTPSPAGSAKY